VSYRYRCSNRRRTRSIPNFNTP
ncbi:hypothetical protein CCACVL1_06012, partial [Corchorus capsularis]